MRVGIFDDISDLGDFTDLHNIEDILRLAHLDERLHTNTTAETGVRALGGTGKFVDEMVDDGLASFGPLN